MAHLRKRLHDAVASPSRGPRFRDGDFDLDLTYLTQRLICCGQPEGGEAEALASMLYKYHGDGEQAGFLLVKLCEAPLPSERLAARTIDMGFMETCGLPLGQLFRAAVMMERWASAEDGHVVVVVHSKKGRSRATTLVAAFLLFTGVFNSPAEALDYANARRSGKLESLQPSQSRYLQYFGETLCSCVVPASLPLHFKRLRLSNVPVFSRKKEGVRLLIEVLDVSDGGCCVVYRSAPAGQWDKLPVFLASQHCEVLVDLSGAAVVVAGDFVVRCYHVKLQGKMQVILSVPLHTHFLDPEAYDVIVPYALLDDRAKPRLYQGSHFHAVLSFSSELPHRPLAPVEFDPFYEDAIRSSLCRSLDLFPTPRDLESLFRHVAATEGLELVPSPDDKRLRSPKSSSGRLFHTSSDPRRHVAGSHITISYSAGPHIAVSPPDREFAPGLLPRGLPVHPSPAACRMSTSPSSPLSSDDDLEKPGSPSSSPPSPRDTPKMLVPASRSFRTRSINAADSAPQLSQLQPQQQQQQQSPPGVISLLLDQPAPKPKPSTVSSFHKRSHSSTKYHPPPSSAPKHSKARLRIQDAESILDDSKHSEWTPARKPLKATSVQAPS